jgi:hypothetical protein
LGKDDPDLEVDWARAFLLSDLEQLLAGKFKRFSKPFGQFWVKVQGFVGVRPETELVAEQQFKVVPQQFYKWLDIFICSKKC